MSGQTGAQIFAYVFLCRVWSSTWLAIPVVVREVPPFKAAALRFVLAAGILFVWGWIRNAQWPRGERQWNAIVVLSLDRKTSELQSLAYLVCRLLLEKKKIKTYMTYSYFL